MEFTFLGLAIGFGLGSLCIYGTIFYYTKVLRDLIRIRSEDEREIARLKRDFGHMQKRAVSECVNCSRYFSSNDRGRYDSAKDKWVHFICLDTQNLRRDILIYG